MDPRFKKNDATLECAACHMKVMARGDWQGWKPVGTPKGQIWYCNKQPCQEQHDILLVQLQRGNIPAALKAGLPGQLIEPADIPTVTETEAMRARIAELEAELAATKGQSTAPAVPEPAAEAAVAAEEQPSMRPRPERVHAEVNGVVLCGADVPLDDDSVKKPEEMSFEDTVCDDCVAAWAKLQEEGNQRDAAARKARHEAYKKGEDPKLADEAARAAYDAAHAPQETATGQEPQAAYVQPLELPAPSSGIPEGLDYSALPKFDTNLIGRINDGAKIESPILLTQATYPDIDFSKIRPGQLRKGISGFFEGVEVDAIDRALVDGEIVGMVFTLKEKAN